MLAGYVLLLAGLWLWARRTSPRGATRTWLRAALVAVALGVVEMISHTASGVDLERLRAGDTTPVLETHLLLAAAVNPVLGIAVAGVAVQGARDRLLGSRWISWLAVVGGALYGPASA